MKTGVTVVSAIIAAIILATVITRYVTASPKEAVVRLSVKRFEYSPNVIVLKKGVAVVIEVESQDVVHGFNVPDLGVRTDVIPGKTARVQLTPQTTGRFIFHCDIFCGTGHEELVGTILVTD